MLFVSGPIVSDRNRPFVSLVIAQCINKCLMEKSGMLVNGEYNVANIQKAFPNAGSPEQIAAKIDQCKAFNGEQCENVAKCADLLHKQ